MSLFASNKNQQANQELENQEQNVAENTMAPSENPENPILEQSAPNEKADAPSEDTKAQSSKEGEKESGKKRRKNKKQVDFSAIGYEEGKYYELQRFFGANWWFVFLFALVTVFYSFYVVNSATSRIEHMEKLIESSNLNVVMTSVDGRAVQVQKQQIEPKYIEGWLRKTLIDDLIVSRVELTNQFSARDFSQVSTIMKNSQRLQHFMDALTKNKLHPKDEASAVRDMRTYLFALQQALAEDTLPEYIAIKEYKTNNFAFRDGYFEIKVSATLDTHNYIASQQKYYKGAATVELTARGSVNLLNAHELNPYGVVVKEFTITLPVKPKNI